MTTEPNRRRVLGGIVGGALAAPFLSLTSARAQENTLNIISHRVHQNVLTGSGGSGGDLVAEWTAETGATVNWTTLDVGPLHDRLFREASLQETEFDIGFVNNINCTPARLGLMENLDGLMQADPIEDWGGVSQGLVGSLTRDGALHGVPMRHATTGFHYNTRLLAEAGFTAPPSTIEETLEIARVVSGQTQGAPISGLSFEGTSYVNFITLARAWDAPFISSDLQVIPNEEGFIRAFRTVQELFAERVLPRNFPVLQQDEVISQMQNGRSAMCYFAYGRHVLFNDPQQSQEAGNIGVTPPPADPALVSAGIVGQSEFWAMVVPANSRRKELAWSFVRHMMSKDATVRAALNGNGPVRPAAYDDARVQAAVPYAASEARSVAVAQVPLPAFDRAVEAGDKLTQKVQLVAVGQATPEQAVRELKTEVAGLL